MNAKKLLVYLKYIMPLASVLIFALYLLRPSVFFVHDGDVKRRQSFTTLSSSTWETAGERLDKLSKEEDPSTNDKSFAVNARVYTALSRIGLGAAIFFSGWAAVCAVVGISLPHASHAAMQCKLLLRLVVPNRWFMALCGVLCLPYSLFPEYISHLYKKYYLYEVTVGYDGLPPVWLLLLLLAVCVGLLFAAAPAERELGMDAYRRYYSRKNDTE